MTYIERTLTRGERILIATHPTMIPYIIGCVLFTLLTLGFGIVVTGPLLLLRWFTNDFTEFTITNKRIVRKLGFVSRRTGEFAVKQVESIEFVQGFVGRIFNYGTIVVHGTGIDDLSMRVRDPIGLRMAIDSAVNPDQLDPIPLVMPPPLRLPVARLSSEIA